MDGTFDYGDLVEKARLGDEESMNRLAESARESLRRYVFRITLDESVTQDIVQEVMLEMFRVLGKLRHTERFLAWLHGIAFNRIRRYYGQQWHRKKVAVFDEEYLSRTDEHHEGLASLVNQELRQIIFAAMNQLEPRHRAVLTMRCYDGMSYAEIGRVMGCSEFGVRALFFRAKKALAKQLSRRGLGRGSLLTALMLFGKMTAVSEAAAAQVSVTAAVTKVGIAAGIAGMATGKAIVTSLAVAGVIAAGAVVATPRGETAGGSGQSSIPATAPAVAGRDNLAKGLHECWYYYPDGSGGPVMMRYMVTDNDGREWFCRWLQNDAGNYSYDAGSNTIYLENHRMWNSDYSVRRLPTDSPELRDFLCRVEGLSVGMDYIGSRGKNLLVIERSDGRSGSSTTWTMRHSNVLDEDYFQCDWPAGAKIVDNRDEIHSRGWAYVVVEGQIAGNPVTGAGQLPFVYAAMATKKPWLRLKMGECEISGDTGGICVRDGGGRIVRSWSGGGGIFAGLGRPWAGLHTIDTVRRDAASGGAWFETRILPERAKAGVLVKSGGLELDYTIDMKKDVIEEIVFAFAGQESLGRLAFSYVQEIDRDWSIPGTVGVHTAAGEPDGIMWLVKLATGRLVSDE